MNRPQIHILRDWNDTIQELPDEIAGILYKAIHNLHTAGLDTASDELAQGQEHAMDALRAARAPDDKRTAANLAASYGKALHLWTLIIMPYYIAEHDKRDRKNGSGMNSQKGGPS